MKVWELVRERVQAAFAADRPDAPTGWKRYIPTMRSVSGSLAVNAGIAVLFVLGFGPVRPPPPEQIEPLMVQLYSPPVRPPEPEPEPLPPPPEPPPEPEPTPVVAPDPEPIPEPEPEPIPEPEPEPEPLPEPEPEPLEPLAPVPIEAPDLFEQPIPDLALDATPLAQPELELPDFVAEPEPFESLAPVAIEAPDLFAEPIPDLALDAAALEQPEFELPDYVAQPEPEAPPQRPAPEPSPAPAAPAPEETPLEPDEEEDEGEAIAAAPANPPAAAIFAPPPSGIAPPPGGAAGLRGLLGEQECRSYEERLRGDCPPEFAGIERPGNDLFGPDLSEGEQEFGAVIGVDESMRNARAFDPERHRPLGNGGVGNLGGAHDMVGRARPKFADPGSNEGQ